MWFTTYGRLTEKHIQHPHGYQKVCKFLKLLWCNICREMSSSYKLTKRQHCFGPPRSFIQKQKPQTSSWVPHRTNTEFKVVHTIKKGYWKNKESNKNKQKSNSMFPSNHNWAHRQGPKPHSRVRLVWSVG